MGFFSLWIIMFIEWVGHDYSRVWIIRWTLGVKQIVRQLIVINNLPCRQFYFIRKCESFNIYIYPPSWKLVHVTILIFSLK